MSLALPTEVVRRYVSNSDSMSGDLLNAPAAPAVHTRVARSSSESGEKRKVSKPNLGGLDLTQLLTLLVAILSPPTPPATGGR
ncbi:hypothetical protein SKAU_G00391880 [Synaphobranchus kaupii]|uniref:Uncharacterized protein n=1 Tax=Synaphobranchus kaupii TaxID=118154 RepID=A0A9Q1EBR4_SYNKA|nr:hypothetical protein SKAU_G00391880 [Synaphobranchus kaupii]